jgi:hypothetical protein
MLFDFKVNTVRIIMCLTIIIYYSINDILLLIHIIVKVNNYIK